MARLALKRGPRAKVGAKVEVVIGGDALAQVGGSRSEVGEGRAGAKAGLGWAAARRLVFTLHVILQTPQVS